MAHKLKDDRSYPFEMWETRTIEFDFRSVLPKKMKKRKNAPFSSLLVFGSAKHARYGSTLHPNYPQLRIQRNRRPTSSRCSRILCSVYFQDNDGKYKFCQNCAHKVERTQAAS